MVNCFEIVYYVTDDNEKIRRNEYTTNNRSDAIEIAKLLKNELGYFPVVIYDKNNQQWVDF